MQEDGNLYVAKAVLIDRDGWWIEKDEKEEPLVLEQNAVEIPTYSIRLLVDTRHCRKYEHRLGLIIENLRHFATISEEEYVSYTKLSGGIERILFTGEGKFSVLAPRLFRKI
jgi:hypothetical protein